MMKEGYFGSIPWLVGFAFLAILAKANPALGMYTDIQQRALQQAVGEFRNRLTSDETLYDATNLAVLPFWGDEEAFVEDLVKSSLTRTRYKVFVRGDSEWDRLLQEMEWSAKREDIMDPETLKTFGKIQGVDAVVYGTVQPELSKQADLRTKVKLSITIAAVETGQLLWTSGPLEGVAIAETIDVVGKYPRSILTVVGLLAGVVLLFLVFLVAKIMIRPR